jgi:NAD(P)-dependent dehydrogenase (short-subunit alcohol dehydrogenase family)
LRSTPSLDCWWSALSIVAAVTIRCRAASGGYPLRPELRSEKNPDHVENNARLKIKHDAANGIDHRWGRIINVSSVNAQKGAFGQTNYWAAKSGMHGFTKALALALRTKA